MGEISRNIKGLTEIGVGQRIDSFQDIMLPVITCHLN